MSRIRLSVRVAVAVFCVVLAGATAARAQSAVDAFDPGANEVILAMAVQSDRKIVLGGEFTMLGGGGTGTTSRYFIGRLNADGSLDTGFDPGANGPIEALVVQPDGKILVGGAFSMLGGGGTGTTARNNIARLNSDGSLDTSFDPGASGAVGALAVQPDGKIVVAGLFTTLGGGGTGTTLRSNIGRLNANGSLDLGFNPGADNRISTLALQPDGKIVVGGAFTKLGGGGLGNTPRHRIGRIASDGSLDTSFDPGLSSFGGVHELAVQPDGKIVVGGFFTALGGGGTTTRNNIGRLNPDGTVDAGFDPGANSHLLSLALQPDGKILIGGNFTALGGGTGTTARAYIGRLNADGSLDLSFNPGASSRIYAIAVQPDGKILAGGNFTGLGGGGTGTTPRSRVGRLYADGSLDTNFDPGASANVLAMALQPDGQLIVGGTFTMLGGGGTGTTARNRLGRLRADGSLDSSFNPAADDEVDAVVVQPDGKIVVGGLFTTLAGGGRNRIGRLNANGSLDIDFNPGANSAVQGLVLQPDAKILAAGYFTSLGGATRNYVGRLHGDGSLDTDFNPGANSPVYTMAVQPNGKILVGGDFTMLGGTTGTTARSRIGRLNADGSLDESFDPGANGFVYAIAVQPDGKILVGGNFTMLGGGGTGTTARNYIGRLNADGSLDTLFNPGANNAVYSLARQTDGKILVGGVFTTLGGGGTGTTTRNRIGRLNADGSLDTSFNPGANDDVHAIAVQPDGKIIFGGSFTTLGGGGSGTATRNRIGRVNNTEAAIQHLSVASNGSTVTWLRSGGGPEVWRVTVESSSDGVTYTSLGNGTRVTGGWQVSGLSLPNQNLFVRARGYYAGGYQNSSSSIVESIRNVHSAIAPAMTAHPSSQDVLGGTSPTFSAAASGSPAPTFRWQVSTNNGGSWANLTDNASYSGVLTPTLTVTSATPGFVKYQFRAVATNAGGSATSNAATLTVHTVAIDADRDGKSDLAIFRPSSGTWFIRNSAAGYTTSTERQWGLAGDVPVAGDYDGDGRMDLAVYRPSDSVWYILQSSTDTMVTHTLGAVVGDLAVPGDYDGDGKTDPAVYRRSTGFWHLLISGTGYTTVSVQWGLSGDVAVPGDYDGDGRTDLAVYRPSTSTWYVLTSTSGLTAHLELQWGLSGDVPVPGDYDGDGLTDVAVYRPATGMWFILQSTSDFTTSVSFQWGLSGDVPVPGDYDGDEVGDLAVYRPTEGVWYIAESWSNYTSTMTFQWGLSGDAPAPNAPIAHALATRSTLATLARMSDFDADRRSDLTVFRPSNGMWHTQRSSTAYTTSTAVQWGLSGDMPVPDDYDGDGQTDFAVYRPSTGTWYIRRSSSGYATTMEIQWGLSGDIPVPGDYDADSLSDPAVYRPATGTWHVLQSRTNFTSSMEFQWGLAGDVPIRGDFDGDAASDLTVYRPSTGTWYTRYSSTAYATSASHQWGLDGDIPVPGEYDGDGRTDHAVYRPATGTWYLLHSSTNQTVFSQHQFGLDGDSPVPGEFDGDRLTDIAVWRPSTGVWYLLRSSSGFTLFDQVQWGLTGDIPILEPQ